MSVIKLCEGESESKGNRVVRWVMWHCFAFLYVCMCVCVCVSLMWNLSLSQWKFYRTYWVWFPFKPIWCFPEVCPAGVWCKLLLLLMWSCLLYTLWLEGVTVHSSIIPLLPPIQMLRRAPLPWWIPVGESTARSTPFEMLPWGGVVLSCFPELEVLEVQFDQPCVSSGRFRW